MDAPPCRVANGGGEQRQRTARAIARAVSFAGGLLAATLLPACARPAADAAASPRVDTGALALVQGDSVRWSRDGAAWVGRMAGDTAPRWVLRPRLDDAATARLCGFVVTGSRLGARLPSSWPIDATVPRLLVRTVAGRAATGVRYLTPGANAHYWYEALSRDGAWRVSLRWPIRSDPARPIPADAPDSVVEAALTPAPSLLDSLAAALVLPEPTAPWRAPSLPSAAEAEEGAVILARDYPDQTLPLTLACPQVTLMLPVVARVDQRLRIPVRRGDRVVARGSVPDGAVRLSFDELAVPPEEQARERTLLRSAIPEAAITAPADGRVTLRVRFLVLPRAQQGVQPVVVSVAVNPPR